MTSKAFTCSATGSGNRRATWEEVIVKITSSSICRLFSRIALACAIALSAIAMPSLSLAQMPPGMKDVDYSYKGQHFVLRFYKDQLLMVMHDGMPVVAFLNGNARPMSSDSQLVSIAQSAASAFKAGTPSEGTPGSAPAAPGLTVDGVISMVGAGLSDDLIITKIQRSGQSFDLSTDDMVRLKKANASDAVIKAMMNATSTPAALPGNSIAGAGIAAPPSASPTAPNPIAENPKMGKLPKEGFMASIGHQVVREAQAKTVIDQLSMRNILPQWDPNKPLSRQFPHIAITVLYAPMGWTDDYRVTLQKMGNIPSCFKLKAVVWLDASRSVTTDEFQWCIQKDMMLSDLQPTYLMSFIPTDADSGQTTGINRTDGPEPPDTLLPNDRDTLAMEAKTNAGQGSKDLNLDQNSYFAFMFANIRRDLGETLNSDGDFRVWVTSIKKAW